MALIVLIVLCTTSPTRSRRAAIPECRKPIAERDSGDRRGRRLFVIGCCL
jgi:hypothetical protein